MTNMKVSLCILTYNRSEILVKLLDSIKGIYPSLAEVIVVDNCSTDGTKELFDNDYGWVCYIRELENIGVAARNTAIKKSIGDVIITIDDDIFGLTEADIKDIKKKLDDNPQIGALNFKVIDAHTGTICNWIHHREVEKFHDKPFLTYEISEGAVAFRKAALLETGLYPEYFFISHEGPDLAFRLIDKGYEVHYFPSIAVQHSHAVQGRKSWFRYYYDTRNLFWLAMRNFPVWYAMRFLFRGLSATFVYSVRDGFFKYWVKGVYDALPGLKRCARDRHQLSKKTMLQLKDIDRKRPSFYYMLSKRLFRKEMRL